MHYYTLYHNPKCSKSRAVLNLLQEYEVDIKLILYLESHPSIKALSDIVKKLDGDVKAIIRPNEPDYHALLLQQPDITQADLLIWLSQHPHCLQRPILVTKERAVIGRPPEAILPFMP